MGPSTTAKDMDSRVLFSGGMVVADRYLYIDLGSR
jgi:hypothetical protein